MIRHCPVHPWPLAILQQRVVAIVDLVPGEQRIQFSSLWPLPMSSPPLNTALSQPNFLQAQMQIFPSCNLWKTGFAACASHTTRTR